MGEARAGRYWCYACSEVVHPVMEVEPKCPLCDSGFVEEMDGRGDIDTDSDLESDRTLNLWSSILFGMMGGFSRRTRLQREEEDDDSDHEFEDFLRRRRRSSAILQLLQSLRDDIRLESDNPESEGEGEGERERERERERESVILINPFNQAVILQGTFDSDRNRSRDSSNTNVGASLGDYFVGPSLDLLLQHLAENDPNRYGTPPAQKEAVNALPTVKIEENMSCSVCLEDVAIGTEVKEMPCKHKFHNGCLLPWLELHSSCPVCRFQLPADESKVSNGSRNGDSRVEGSGGNDGDEDDRDGERFWLPVPWPFNGPFSLSRSENGSNSSSNSPSSTASGSDSHSEEN